MYSEEGEGEFTPMCESVGLRPLWCRCSEKEKKILQMRGNKQRNNTCLLARRYKKKQKTKNARTGSKAKTPTQFIVGVDGFTPGVID